MTKSMVRLAAAALAAVLLGTAPAGAGDAKAETDFVTRAANGDLTALAESRLALERTGDPQVKDFAQRLMDQHGAAATALRDAASGSGAAMPTTLDASHAARVSTLQAETGVAFDKNFVADQAEVHSNALTLYADYMLLGDNAKLKAYATRMIPQTEALFKAAQKLLGP